MRRYQNRAIEAVQVIEELIELAKELREADARGEQLGLSEDELAFYDALETNDSAVQVLGDETFREIARELVKTARAAYSAQVRLSAGQVGEGDTDGSGAGGVVVGRVSGRLRGCGGFKSLRTPRTHPKHPLHFCN